MWQPLVICAGSCLQQTFEEPICTAESSGGWHGVVSGDVKDFLVVVALTEALSPALVGAGLGLKLRRSCRALQLQ